MRGQGRRDAYRLATKKRQKGKKGKERKELLGLYTSLSSNVLLTMVDSILNFMYNKLVILTREKKSREASRPTDDPLEIQNVLAERIMYGGSW